jgi:hypothetical protein
LISRKVRRVAAGKAYGTRQGIVDVRQGMSADGERRAI